MSDPIKIKYGQGAPEKVIRGYTFYLDLVEDTLYEYVDGVWVVRAIHGMSPESLEAPY